MAVAGNYTENEIPRSPFKFAWWCSRGNRLSAWGAFAAVAFGCSCSLSQHYIIKNLTDAAAAVEHTDASSISTLWQWAIAYPLMVLISHTAWRISGFCGMRWITKTGATIYETLFQYLSNHSSSYFSDRFAGALSNKISNAASGVQALQAKFLWEILTLLFTSAGSMVLAYQAHTYLALILGGWLIFFLGFNTLAVKRVKKYSYTHAETSSELKGKIVDSTSNIDVVHQSGHVNFEQDYVGEYIDKSRKAHLKSWMVFEWVLVFNSTFITLFNALMLGTSVFLLSKHYIEVGALVMIITLMVSLQRQLFFIGHVIAEAMREYGQVQEGLDELLLPHDITNQPNARDVAIKSGAVSFKQVSFSYDNQDVFENFNLHIQPGQKVGLVGASGVGKSTLVSLILRQYEVDSGAIELDGTPIKDITLESLRKCIALVPQSTSLFHRTILENIRYGNLNASDEAVEQAARKAQAHEFINRYPESYRTFVGERGVKLSGGQRQRIAIARAILKDAPLLILDEATSALDSESEHAIQQALEQLMTGKTVIAIAHRLSTLRAMDRILVLDAGKIVEDGTHEQLLSSNGIYSRLWSSQVHGFLQNDLTASDN